MKATPIILLQFLCLLLLMHLTGCISSPSRTEGDPSKTANLQPENQIPIRTINLFPVVVQGKYGFIDQGGNLLIPPQFDGASGFSEGLAPVRVGLKWGFIDETGTIVIQPRFFAYNLAYKEPMLTTFPNYTRWHGLYFSEGLAVAQEDVDKPWGYIDKSGTEVIPARFQLAHPFSLFSKGVATAMIDGEWVTIDKSGTVISRRYKFDLSHRFVDGLKLVGKKKDSWSPSSHFHGDYSLPPYGYVDSAGRQVIDFRFDAARNFSEGLAAVRVGRKWGYIDKNGKQVIPAMFDIATEFHAGIAAVKVGKATAYIDMAGKYIWGPKE